MTISDFPLSLKPPYRIILANNPINLVDPWGLEFKRWIFIPTSVGFNVFKYGSGEVGTYYLIDPSTGEYHQWGYWSAGVGFGWGAALQVEAGEFFADVDPCQISSHSLTLSAFAAAILKGASGQITSTSFLGEGGVGATAGWAAGGGYGISGMYTRSYYIGKGNIRDLPKEYRDLYKKLTQ